MKHSCRMCHDNNLKFLMDLGEVPVAHRFLDSMHELEQRFPITLYLCQSCGLVQIVEPIDPDILYGSYNGNFSSWKFEPHLNDQIDTILTYGLPRTTFEIGCNDGRFLNELRQRGCPICVGVEPNPVSSGMARERGLVVFNEMVNQEVCERAVAEFGRFDLVLSRQVLEHVLDIDNFFACVDRLLSDDGLLFLDVPDFLPALTLGDASMLWEEHVSHFTDEVLYNMLLRYDFIPGPIRTYNFSGGTLAVTARRNRKSTLVEKVSIDKTLALAERFPDRVLSYSHRLSAALGAAKTKGMEVVLYGVGCRATVLVNVLGIGGLIDFSVDDQKERHHKFIAGNHIEVQPSELLKNGTDPLLCLLGVNNENEEKIKARLAGMLSRPVHCISLFGANDTWRELEQLEALVG